MLLGGGCWLAATCAAARAHTRSLPPVQLEDVNLARKEEMAREMGAALQELHEQHGALTQLLDQMRAQGYEREDCSSSSCCSSDEEPQGRAPRTQKLNAADLTSALLVRGACTAASCGS